MMNYLCAFCGKWWPSIITFVLAAVMTGVFIWMGWGDLQVYNPPPRSEIVRNYGLLVVAFWGAFLAVWRSQIAKQQADSALQQAKSASRQAETSERGLRNDQFQRGVEMLNSEKTAIRLAGIYALGRVAQDHPENYLDQVIRLLAAFVRRPAYDEETAKPPESGTTKKLRFREDVWEAVRIISKPISNEAIKNEVTKHDRPNIARSDLIGMIFQKKNFSGMILNDADMQKATFNHCDFTGASLIGANLTGARLVNSHCHGTEFFEANFKGTDISSTDFCEAIGLTQEQLDQACQRRCSPPKNLPPGLTWDEEDAAARWEKLYGGES